MRLFLHLLERPLSGAFFGMRHPPFRHDGWSSTSASMDVYAPLTCRRAGWTWTTTDRDQGYEEARQRPRAVCVARPAFESS